MRKTHWMSLAALLVLLSAGPVSAGNSAWSGHVDASLISEIISHNGEFYIASSGGLLVYNPADSTFDQYDNSIGLPSNYLTCVAFARDGRLYAGTLESGMSVLTNAAGGFNVDNLSSTFHGLADDHITSVAAWGDTVVYGSQGGAGLILGGFAGRRFVKDDGLPSNDVADVFPAGDFVWIATDSGVARLDRQGFITDVSAGLPTLDTHVLARDDTTMWAGTTFGVARFDDALQEWVPVAGVNGIVFSMGYEPVTQTLWAGTRGEFFSNNGSGWTNRNIINIYVKYDLSNTFSELRGLLPTPDGSVYMGTGDPRRGRGGFLILWDGTSVRDLVVEGPPMNNLLRLSPDIDGSMWVSSFSFGVGKLTPDGHWFNYNRAAGDNNLNSRFTNLTCLADSKGSKWFSTLSTPAAPVPMNELQDQLDTDRTNDLWASYGIGDGGGDGLQSLRGQNAVEDPYGNLWFLSDEEPYGNAPNWWGINILSEDRTRWRHITPTSTNGGMLSRNVTDVAFDQGGQVYVALRFYGVQSWFTGGLETDELFDLTNDGWTTNGTSSADFNAAGINALAVRSDGVIWIGTELGLFKMDTVGRFTEFRANRGFGVGLLSDNVRDVILDREENVWVATDLGLNWIDRDDETDIQSFTTPAVWQQQLSLFFPPSVVSPLVDASCNALALHPTEPWLYVATRGGLSVLDIGALSPATTNLARVYVYPNPIRRPRGDNAIRIGNLNDRVDVKIYTLEGELVHEAYNVTASDDAWDLTTASGYLAAPGIYVVRISGDTGTVVKRVALIR